MNSGNFFFKIIKYDGDDENNNRNNNNNNNKNNNSNDSKINIDNHVMPLTNLRKIMKTAKKISHEFLRKINRKINQ